MANTKTTAKAVSSTAGKEKTEDINSLKNENKELRSALEALQAQVSLLINASPKIKEDNDEIEVISMCNQVLNLSTDGYGRGNIYTFNGFGESMPIERSELKKIILNNRSFAESGLFYVNDKDFVDSIGFLKVAYKKILDYDKMNTLFDCDFNTFLDAFSKCNMVQKTVFASLLVDRIANGEKIDMNIVQECGKAIDRDIMAEVELAKGIYKK